MQIHRSAECNNIRLKRLQQNLKLDPLGSTFDRNFSSKQDFKDWKEETKLNYFLLARIHLDLPEKKNHILRL